MRSWPSEVKKNLEPTTKGTTVQEKASVLGTQNTVLTILSQLEELYQVGQQRLKQENP